MNILKSITEIRGVHYIYNNYVMTGGITTAVFLEMIGYKKFNEKKSVFYPDPKNPEKRKIRISKDKRYVIINSGKTSFQDIGIMSELITSQENVFGEYIQVIVTSATAKEGVNFYNVVAEHMTPEWSWSGNYQAESRGLRVDSHDRLLEISQNIIDDILNMLNHKQIASNSDLYQEANALVVSQ
ncbi:unnamed protein product, partial [marine sediment metagenome]